MKVNEYTEEEIESLIRYLNYGVKEGYISDDVAEKIIESKKWEAVEKMIDMEEYYNEL